MRVIFMPVTRLYKVQLHIGDAEVYSISKRKYIEIKFNLGFRLPFLGLSAIYFNNFIK